MSAFCPRCGTLVEAAANFCSNCGGPLKSSRSARSTTTPDQAETASDSETSEHAQPKKSVDRIIGASLLAVAFLNGGINLVIAKAISQRGVSDPGVEGRAEFIGLFMSTLLLSVTMALAVAVFVLPRIFGRDWDMTTSFVVIALGAPVAGLPVHLSYGHNSFAYWVTGSLTAFLLYYGPAFYSGEITGLASGVILGVLALHYRKEKALVRSNSDTDKQIMFKTRPPQAWRVETGILIVLIIGFTVLAARSINAL
jgi:zinc-ribbon domain